MSNGAEETFNDSAEGSNNAEETPKFGAEVSNIPEKGPNFKEGGSTNPAKESKEAVEDAFCFAVDAFGPAEAS